MDKIAPDTNSTMLFMKRLELRVKGLDLCFDLIELLAWLARHPIVMITWRVGWRVVV